MIKKSIVSIALCLSLMGVLNVNTVANAAIAKIPVNLGTHWIDAYVWINGVKYPAHLEWDGLPDKINLNTLRLYVRLGFPTKDFWTIIPNPGRFLGPTINPLGPIDSLPGFFPGNNNPSKGKMPGTSL